MLSANRNCTVWMYFLRPAVRCVWFGRPRVVMNSDSREWLEADGLGGFDSGTPFTVLWWLSLNRRKGVAVCASVSIES